MVNVWCKTNLDAAKSEKWPTYLPCRPVVGDYIQSETKYKDGFRLSLRVCSVSFEYSEKLNGHICIVELHIPSYFQTIPQWEDWFLKASGRTY